MEKFEIIIVSVSLEANMISFLSNTLFLILVLDLR